MKKMIIRKQVIAIVITCCFVMSTAQGGGIPVIDASSLAQQIEQVVSWGKQLQAMKQQYDQQLTQYQSMTGQRGFGNALNDPKLRQYLPAEWKNLYDKTTANQPLSQAMGLNLNKHIQAYDIATQEQTQIQGLIDQIQNTNDPKSIAELQARIAGEQAKIQNAVVQLQLSNQLAEIQNKLQKQIKHEAFIKNMHDEVGKPMTYPAPITNWGQ